MKREHGFTLLEILIALFIFTVLSLIMVGALRTVINAQSGSDDKADRLRQLQLTLLVMSRDIEQAVNRPIVNAAGKEEAAFIGEPDQFQFTHTGFANPMGVIARSSLQRSGYVWKEEAIFRLTYPVLDEAPKTTSEQRLLLTHVEEVHFKYLDHEGRFHDNWPVEDKKDEPLPRGIKIDFTLVKWGKLSQLYLVPTSSLSNANKPDEKNEKKG